MPLCAVLVLYRRCLSDSETFASLTATVERAGLARDELELVVYDNGPVAQTVPPWRHPIRYHHDPANGGLVAAYNHALGVCDEIGADWLLLLDQDSRLPSDYLARFAEARRWTESRTVAIVPKVRSAGQVVSPLEGALGLPNLYPVRDDAEGLFDHELTAINAGAFVRTAFLREVGGYPASYWVECVDLWFFATAYVRRRNVYVMPVWLDHALSLSEVETVDLARWERILRAEVQCCLETRGRLARALHAAVMFRRAATLFARDRTAAHAWSYARHGARLLSKAVTGAAQ